MVEFVDRARRCLSSSSSNIPMLIEKVHPTRSGPVRMRVNFLVARGLQQTDAVHEQHPDGLPARDPDRLIKWFVGVVVVGVGVNLVSGFVLEQKWAWLPPAVFVSALLVAVPRTGLLRREREGATRWARGLAFLALAAYLAVAIWGPAAEGPTPVMILSIVFLWGAGVVLIWSTLLSRRRIGEIAIGTSALLVGSAYLFVAGGLLLNLLGSHLRLVATATLLLGGIACLLFGIGVLLYRAAFLGVAFILFGIVGLLAGVGYLIIGSSRLGLGFLSLGASVLLLGVSFLLDQFLLGGLALLLFGIGGLQLGFSGLFDRVTLAADRNLDPVTTLDAVAFLLLGVGGLLGGLSLLLDRSRLLGAAFVGFAGAAVLEGMRLALFVQVVDLSGATFFPGALIGVSLLLTGVACLLLGMALSYGNRLPRRIWAWLRTRDDATSGLTS
jgi:hypothetical protein